jgi:uncharacterized repeat protein (TIGR01451 family)
MSPVPAPALAATLLVALTALLTRPALADDAAQTAAEATGSGPLETTIVVETLRVEQGPGDREVRRWEPAGRLATGEELHYTVRVRNPGQEPVTDAVVTKRLPFGVRYELGSASGPACEVQLSSDGGTTFVPREAVLKGRDAKGKKGSRRPPPVTEFTHVRWVLTQPLAPGATALLRFRAKFT